METNRELTVGELASAAGISRRTLRFYVTRGLLPAPEGRGRGARYTQKHLHLLQEISRLQDAGLSLTAISLVLTGQQAEEAAIESAVPVSRGNRGRNTATSSWLRIQAGDGIELHLDAGVHNPTAEQIRAATEALHDILSKR